MWAEDLFDSVSLAETNQELARSRQTEAMDQNYLFVEGVEDVECLRLWFHQLFSRLNPVAADSCLGVLKKVRERREENRPAWGIVDRDVVLSHKGFGSAQDRERLFLEADDREFRSRVEAVLPGVHVLNRWEMENYLLEPSIIRSCWHKAFRDIEAPAHYEFADSLLQLAEICAPRDAGQIAETTAKIDSELGGPNRVKDQFAFQEWEPAKLRALVERALRYVGLTESRLGAIEAKLEVSGGSSERAAELRWRDRCRLVKGKAFVARLKAHLQKWVKDYIEQNGGRESNCERDKWDYASEYVHSDSQSDLKDAVAQIMFESRRIL